MAHSAVYGTVWSGLGWILTSDCTQIAPPFYGIPTLYFILVLRLTAVVIECDGLGPAWVFAPSLHRYVHYLQLIVGNSLDCNWFRGRALTVSEVWTLVLYSCGQPPYSTSSLVFKNAREKVTRLSLGKVGQIRSPSF